MVEGYKKDRHIHWTDSYADAELEYIINILQRNKDALPAPVQTRQG